MTLTKPIKLLVGLATLWLALYPLLFFVVWLFFVFGTMGLSSERIPENTMPVFMLPFFIIFPLHFLTILLYFVLMTFYLVHVIKNTIAAETVRVILGVGCFMMPYIAMPIYYYLYIWLPQPPAWAQAPGSTGQPPA